MDRPLMLPAQAGAERCMVERETRDAMFPDEAILQAIL
jgi:hypothetical protein